MPSPAIPATTARAAATHTLHAGNANHWMAGAASSLIILMSLGIFVGACRPWSISDTILHRLDDLLRRRRWWRRRWGRRRDQHRRHRSHRQCLRIQQRNQDQDGQDRKYSESPSPSSSTGLGLELPPDSIIESSNMDSLAKKCSTQLRHHSFLLCSRCRKIDWP